MNDRPKHQYIRTATAAEMLGVTQRTIQRYLASGKLEGQKFHARTYMVLVKSVREMQARRAPRRAPKK